MISRKASFTSGYSAIRQRPTLAIARVAEFIVVGNSLDIVDSPPPFSRILFTRREFIDTLGRLSDN